MSLSTVKLLNSVTYETIDGGSDTSEAPEDGSIKAFSTTASETIDSGIGNDEVASESSISSRVLGFRSSELKNNLFECANNEEDTETRVTPKKTFPRTSTEDTKVTSPAPKVAFVTSRFACLSDMSDKPSTSEKSPPTATSPPTSSASSHFNIRLLKENVLRENENPEIQPGSPGHEDSASTCSFLTVSGSSGYFSKAGTAEGSASPKFSPSADAFAQSEDPDESGHQKASSAHTERSHTNAQPSESFIPTRFSFLTKEYLPSNVSKDVSQSLPTSPAEVCDPTVASTAPSTSSDESSATVITSTAIHTSVKNEQEPVKPLAKSRFFPFLNLNRVEADQSPEEPMSPASDESQRSPSGDMVITVAC